MTPLHAAARALVAAVKPCPGMESIGLSYIPPDALEALRAALAAPSPSPGRTPTDEEVRGLIDQWGAPDECYADPDAANQAYDDLRRERDGARDAALEEAARECDAEAQKHMGHARALHEAMAVRLRSLKGQPAAPSPGANQKEE